MGHRGGYSATFITPDQGGDINRSQLEWLKLTLNQCREDYKGVDCKWIMAIEGDKRSGKCGNYSQFSDTNGHEINYKVLRQYHHKPNKGNFFLQLFNDQRILATRVSVTIGCNRLINNKHNNCNLIVKFYCHTNLMFQMQAD